MICPPQEAVASTPAENSGENPLFLMIGIVNVPVPTIFATGLSTIAAIIAVKTLEKMNRFKVDRDKQDD